MKSGHHAVANYHHKTFVRKGTDPFIRTWTHDLTLEEIHIELSEGFAVGDLVDIEVMLGPDEPHPLRFRGEVTRFVDKKMKVKFIDLTETQKEQIKLIVSHNTKEPLELQEELEGEKK